MNTFWTKENINVENINLLTMFKTTMNAYDGYKLFIHVPPTFQLKKRTL